MPTDAMQVESIRVADLHEDPANVRRHPQRNLATIKASLARFGLQKPLVIDANNVVRAGNGTLAAARELGWETIGCVRTPLVGSEATAYSVADNRSAELAEWHEEALADTLRALQGEEFDLTAVGFTDAEIDELFEDLGAEGDDEDGLDSDESFEGSSEDGPKIFDDEAIIDSAFRWFRATGFPYRNLPIHVCMRQINKLAAMEPGKLLRTTVAYQIADTYHRHRFHSSAEGMRSPHESFHDDDSLRKAIKLSLEHNKDVETVLWIVNGTQACSNFRPGFACKLYRDYCKPGDTVLDTSTGYGGRLIGFMASGIAGRYIGIDPNVPTHEANLKMASDLGFADRVELHNLPAEDLPHDILAGRCDFAFTSPPYFRKEHYSDAPTQSWVRYRSGEAWRDGFLVPMLMLQFAALKPGKFAVVNIADVTIKDRLYPLVKWTIIAGIAAGFIHVRTDRFEMQVRIGVGQDDEVASEPVIVFRKPDHTSNGSSTELPP